jgi:hypothetical protein
MDPLEPPPHAAHVVTADGEAFIWQARPDIIIQLASGTVTLPMARCFTDFLRPILASGTRCLRFADFERLVNHTREAREHLNAFGLEHARAFAGVHFLISSKFVALGLSTFKAQISEDFVRVYSDRESFLRSLQSALAEHQPHA